MPSAKEAPASPGRATEAEQAEVAKQYMEKFHIMSLFESLATALIHAQPDQPVDFIVSALEKYKAGEDAPSWDTFLDRKHVPEPAPEAAAEKAPSPEKAPVGAPAPPAKPPSGGRRPQHRVVDQEGAPAEPGSEDKEDVMRRNLASLENEDRMRKNLSSLENEDRMRKNIASLENEEQMRKNISSLENEERMRQNLERLQSQDGGDASEEVTYAMIKPDAVSAGNVDAIIERLTADGFRVLARKDFTFSKEQAEQFYAEHNGRPFFEGLVGFMTSGPVVGLQLSRADAIKGWRALIGPTNSEKAREEAPDSIRAKFGTDGQKNACHGSDSPESAAREIGIVFAGSASASEPLRIIIAGAPCSGKGTQCARIVQDFGVTHLSTGDILRAAIKEGSEVGLKAKEYSEKGELVPDDVVISLVQARLEQDDCKKNGWLLDGFPRTPAQAEFMVKNNILPNKFVLLDVADQALIDRVVGRRMDPETGDIYHLVSNPPKDEAVAARLIQREDDTEEKVKRRIEIFHENVNGIKTHFESLLKVVDGNRDPDAIYADVASALKSA